MMSQQIADVIISGNTVFTGLSDQPEPSSLQLRTIKLLRLALRKKLNTAQVSTRKSISLKTN